MPEMLIEKFFRHDNIVICLPSNADVKTPRRLKSCRKGRKMPNLLEGMDHVTKSRDIGIDDIIRQLTFFLHLHHEDLTKSSNYYHVIIDSPSMSDNN